MDKFQEKYDFNLDWSEIYSLVEHSCDHLENEGIKFDFNDPVIMRFVKMDVELCIHHLNNGEKIDIMDFVHFNDLDDGKEIIKDLEDFKRVSNSEVFRDTLEKILNPSGEGRPPFDVVLMFKIMILQVLYDMTDEDIVKWVKTPSLKWFLDYPEEYPAESTFWKFKENLIKFDLFDEIWEVHQEQLNSYGFGVTEDVLDIGQDSKIITTNQGNYTAPRGDEAKTRRSKHATSVKKGGIWYFGYKLHQIMDLTYQLIRIFEVTTASVHDGKVKFSMINKVLYGDKGYVGVVTDSYPAHMLRKSNDPLTNEYRKKRNKRISAKRFPVERPFASLESMGTDTVKTTTVARTKLRLLIACMIFNFNQVITLERQEKEAEKREKEAYVMEDNFFDYDLSVDMSIINGDAEKLLKQIKCLKKRREMRIKNRDINKYMYKKPIPSKKIKKDECPNHKPTTVEKLGYTFYKIQ